MPRPHTSSFPWTDSTRNFKVFATNSYTNHTEMFQVYFELTLHHSRFQARNHGAVRCSWKNRIIFQCAIVPHNPSRVRKTYHHLIFENHDGSSRYGLHDSCPRNHPGIQLQLSAVWNKYDEKLRKADSWHREYVHKGIREKIDSQFNKFEWTSWP